MKKIFLALILFLNFAPALSKEVLAPAVQFDLNDYKNYFLKTTDYHLYLKSRSDYKITCDSDIIGVVWGDVDNIKMFDIKDDFGEIADMKSVIVKIKYETYSYIRLYKQSKEIVNLIVNVNPMFDNSKNITLGLCELEPYRE